jgi:hypothetical protein
VPFPSGARPNEKEKWKEKGNVHVQEYIHNMKQVPSIEVPRLEGARSIHTAHCKDHIYIA